ncbi:hypothetical protein V1634_23450 [Plantactinospora veratri]|uniref:Uncharacterized protein n=1 Tax=Plantactinospora veratri TaxID=1436122 RepID=A0ABU7SJ93_9ACTN
MILSLRRQATVAVAALVAGASPLLSGVAVEASVSLTGAGAAPVRIFPAGSVGRVEVGSVPHGPDVAGPRSAGAPQEAAPGSYPPPPDRLGGAAALRAGRAEPVRPAEEISLLVLVATICVVGVSAGAIRAIFAQRTRQTVIA